MPNIDPHAYNPLDSYDTPTMQHYLTPDLHRTYSIVKDKHAAELLRRAVHAFQRDWDTSCDTLLPDAMRVAATNNAVLGIRNAAHWAFQVCPELRCDHAS